MRHYTRLIAPELRDRPRPVPARLVHDEAQPAPQREGRADAGLCRCPPARPAADRARRAGGDQRAGALADRADRHARRGDDAQGRRARRAVRRAVHQGGAAKRAARTAQVMLVPESAHGTNPATAAFAGFADREHPRHRRRPGRSGRADCAARAGRCGGDDHQPQHLRAVRARHEGDLRCGPCGGRLRLLRRRELQRDRRQGPPRRPWHRCDAHQPAQDLLHPARRRRAGFGAGGAVRSARAVRPAALYSARCRWLGPADRGRRRARPSIADELSAGWRRSTARWACSPAR